MSMKLGILSIATSVAIMAAASVSASTFNVVAFSTQGAGNQADVFAPNHTNYTNGGASWDFNPTWTSGNQGGISQSPFNNTTLDPSYFSVIASGAPGSGGGVSSPATLSFGKQQTAFNMLWGSIDSYNKIEFFLNGQVGPVGSWTGSDVIAELVGQTGTAPNFEQVALLRFDFDDGFDSVKFSSTGNSFEFALAPVPLPAAGLLLLTALGGMKVMSRRRKREDA